MKATVVNVLLSSIFCCFSFNNPLLANSVVTENREPEIPLTFSAKILSNEEQPIFTIIFKNIVNRIFSLDNENTVNFSFYENPIDIFDRNLDSNLKFIDDRNLSLGKLPYTHQQSDTDLVLGFQNTFWSSRNNQKYWGVTTVEHWGNTSENNSNLPKSNYNNAAPSLPKGDSALTLSGGGNSNLVRVENNNIDNNTPGEFEDFRGGVAFHRGVSDRVTMGVGFVYEDLLVGFSQITFADRDFPFKTTISLLTGSEGLEIHSHVRFQPTRNFILNYYNDPQKQKFDFNWGLIPGLNLTAKGNSQQKSVSTGMKIAIDSEYLSLSAKVELDNDRQWQWHINSQLGPLQLIYSSDRIKSNSELNLKILQSESVGFHCSAFFRYETRQHKEQEEYLSVWGGRLHSHKKINNAKYAWSLDLGVGSGSQGVGLIAATSVVLNPNLLFKITYQEISPISDDTQIKFQLSSK